MKQLDHKECTVRVNRILGQVQGIKKMIEEKRYCIDIISQLKAIRSAVKSVEVQILQKHIENCVKNTFNENNKDDIQEKIAELIKLLQKSD